MVDDFIVWGMIALCGVSAAAERTVEPTFLKRTLQAASVRDAGKGCAYAALFGEGDREARVARGVARYGEIRVDAGGECDAASYAREEQIYVVTDGAGTLLYGGRKQAIRKDDFLYVPPGARHAISSAGGCRIVAMGFRAPTDAPGAAPPGLLVANIGEVKKQTVGSHPDSVQYRLLMGDARSTRDRIAAGRTLTSLFVMEFAPGGTNFPHHHETEEEIYLLLDGRGEMVAGSGADGVQGRFPARPGDAYFFRLNCTVGFYSDPGTPSRILAVRSLFPFRGR